MSYREQVVVVFLVLGGERVHGVVGSRHGVHEGGQGSVQHLEERITDWVSGYQDNIKFNLKYSLSCKNRASLN